MAKVIPMRKRRTKHKPYHCDVCGSWLRDQDVVDRRGRANKYRTWAVGRDSLGDLVPEREDRTVCMRCTSEGRPERFLRKETASLVSWFAGNDAKKEEAK